MRLSKDKIRAYALKNAIHYKGKANNGAVISGLFAEGLKKDEVRQYSVKIKEVIDEVNRLSLDEQKRDFDKFSDLISEREIREGLPELPDVPKKGVVMRFRPAPSGPLHVGHIISNLASSMYVNKYGGKFYVIIDDTSPETTLKNSYKEIKEDCDWIFGNVTKYINSSDRMDLYYGYAVALIEKKSAYVCTCSAESFKDLAMKKKDCQCRDKSVKDNLFDWEGMVSKNFVNGFKPGAAILRFKTPEKYGGMKHKNPAMRDFPLARINESKHPLQGKKYRVWPLMNLVVSVDDMEFGMTHIIRGKDHRDNAERQKMIFEVFGKKYPWTFFIGRIKFNDLALSKRRITAGIESGEFSGADDKKLPTIASLRKRGYKPEAFRKFVEQRGLTEVDKVISSKDFFKAVDVFNKE